MFILPLRWGYCLFYWIRRYDFSCTTQPRDWTYDRQLSRYTLTNLYIYYIWGWQLVAEKLNLFLFFNCHEKFKGEKNKLWLFMYKMNYFSRFLSLKVRDVYYTQELNINFLSSYVHRNIQDGMTKCQLYLESKGSSDGVMVSKLD